MNCDLIFSNQDKSIIIHHFFANNNSNLNNKLFIDTSPNYDLSLNININQQLNSTNLVLDS